MRLAPAGPEPRAAGILRAVNDIPDLGLHDAVLFDLDGVLTPTAEVHRAAWRELFAPYLASRGAAPYQESDYFEHLDGRQRYDGVAALLASRGLSLPRGAPDDPPEAETVCGLGNRKNAVFQQVLDEEGVAPFAGAVALVDALIAAGVTVAVVSGSRNARTVLAAAGLTARFPLVVGGIEAAELSLASKPAPDAFLHAAAVLGVEPAHAVVIEDAIAGVAAGRAGGFGLIVGVGTDASAPALREAGADIVVADLAPLAERVTGGGVDRERWPAHEWRLVEKRPPTGVDGVGETLFALGNGYLGLRGNSEEGGPAHEHGTFINGFFEAWEIEYPEAAYGFATAGQTIVNVPDAKTIRLSADGERLDLATADLEEYERSLDLRSGTLLRRLVWRTAAGKRLEVASTRLASFERRNLALITYRVTALDAPAHVELESLLVNRQDGEGEFAARRRAAGLDPRRSDELAGRVLVPTAQTLGEDRVGLAFETRRSRLGVAALVEHTPAGETTVHPDRSVTRFAFDLPAGESVTVVKKAVYLDGVGLGGDELLAAAGELMDGVPGVAVVIEEQRAWCAGFWERADVRVHAGPQGERGDDGYGAGAADDTAATPATATEPAPRPMPVSAMQRALQQAIRWNVFQLAQAAARADGRGVSAKGVSGSGYSGHYFWDTEVFVLPFLAYAMPAAARSTLELRHALLPAARRRAAVMSLAGALFAWRTIAGEEASAYYPAGTAQYHIDADVAYAVLRYAGVTGDEEFLLGPGAEILVETARMWRSLGFFSERDGRFHLHSVTGPDEYSAVVNDNFYTNAMARLNLERAADVAERRPGLLDTTPAEVAEWRRAAAAMALPFDERLGVNAQDAEFLSRQRWDLAATPREKRPLLLHYHPLVIYRHQVLKQTDLVLAEFLLGSRFSAEQKRRDFEYYDPLTTGDSTLSAAVQSIMAAEVGYQRRAYRHFRRMLWTDLANLHANTADGVHVAAMGGTWLALVCGFGGLRDDAGELRFDPRLPAGWSALEFRLGWRGSALRVKLSRASIGFRLLDGAPVPVRVRGEAFVVDGEVKVTLADQGPVLD